MNDKSATKVRLDVQDSKINEMRQEKLSPNDTISLKGPITMNLKFILLTSSFKLLKATLRVKPSMQGY